MTREELDEVLRLHALWLAGEAGGERADLSDADLRDADLRCADLRGADLRRCVGNGREIKTILTDAWPVVYTATDMAIGCQRHAIAAWWSFSDDQIAEMDKRALDFWRKWKPILQQIMGSYEK